MTLESIVQTVLLAAGVTGALLALGLVLLLWLESTTVARYCPLDGNAVTDEWDEIVIDNGQTWLWTWRGCPIYRDQREDEIYWRRHYHKLVRRKLQPPLFDEFTGKERKG